MKTALAAACMLALAGPALAAPYTPASGSQVIERVPPRSDPAQHELRRMRAQLAASPHDLALAADLAQRYIALARAGSDPRYYGHAQAALAPWWTMPAPPARVRVLRATLLQSTHRFAEALADLDAVVSAAPADAQAWLTRATVQTVTGDYAAANASCARLSGLAPQLVSAACAAGVATLSGRSEASEVQLERDLRQDSGAAPVIQSWVLTLLAEMAVRRGDIQSAELRFLRALALDPRDSYLVGAYADLLLDQQRAREVLVLTQDQLRIDALLLRHALALKQMPGRESALRDASSELAARFAAAQQRGDATHQREQARYELHLRADSNAALALARQNWAIQKEPADIRILLEAALAANDLAAAAPAIAWVNRHALEDVAIQRLARRIAEGK